MALTGPQKVTVAEITLEKYARIEALAPLLNSDQETSIVADLATWATIRDRHVRLEGGSDGIDLDNDRKRAAIRGRIRLAMGLPLNPSALCPTPRVFAGGVSKADIDTRNADTDRPKPAFTSDLHSV
ncbi:MAG TPA: hypothetical protein VHO25_15840 [Polyangiaceae bacterium]|nr:hypothetical protein [Polyangiaceae bacterium]